MCGAQFRAADRSGDAAERAPTVALALDRPGAEAQRAGRSAASWRGAAISTRCARLSAMGVDPEQGVLRLSFTHYTTKDEIDQLLKALDDVL